jgi:Uma2 family endonuclease
MAEDGKLSSILDLYDDLIEEEWMTLLHAKTDRWTVDEYLRLYANAPLPRSERVELIEGQIIKMAAMGSRHTEAIINSNEVLILAFRASHRIACQVEFRMGEYSCPEPDFSVIRRDLPTATAFQQADLVIEVSDTSLAFDRSKKASLYAKTGIPEYWLLNVRKRQVEIRRQPGPKVTAVFGFDYHEVIKVGVDQTVTPLCRPDIALAVATLF